MRVTVLYEMVKVRALKDAGPSYITTVLSS